jgi:hypothetical protein
MACSSVFQNSSELDYFGPTNFMPLVLAIVFRRKLESTTTNIFHSDRKLELEDCRKKLAADDEQGGQIGRNLSILGGNVPTLSEDFFCKSSIKNFY